MDDGKLEEDAENGDIDREGVGDAAQEADALRILRDHGQPSPREKEIHRCIHIPFRAWCRECVSGRGRERQHRRIDDEDGIPRVSIEYMFLTVSALQRASTKPRTSSGRAAGFSDHACRSWFSKTSDLRAFGRTPLKARALAPPSGSKLR